VAAAPAPAERRESPGAILANNLIAARAAAKMTQHELAAAAGVSPATVAQLENRFSDPRLSTVVNLAEALRVSPLVLLTGVRDANQLVTVVDQGGDAAPRATVRVSPHDAQRLGRLIASGMQRDRVRAARLGAAVAEASGLMPPAVVTTAVFAAICGAPGARAGSLIAQPAGPGPMP
jgi:transcriptional regulator with XRE-family HTH domain